MLQQVVSLAAAAVLFPLILWVPGALLAYAADLLGFRKREPLTQVCLGLLFSVSVSPILVYLLARTGGWPTVWTVYAVIWTVAAILAVRAWRPVTAAAGVVARNGAFWTLIVVWFAICAISEIDIPSRASLYRNLNAMDAVAHVSFTSSITRTGIPPVNPFIFPGFPIHVFYYYLWYMMCSLVDQLGGSLVTARAGVQAGAFYVGLTVAALIAAYVDIVIPNLPAAVSRVRGRVAIALLAITGLDLLGFLFQIFMARYGKGPGLLSSMEWWNEQVTAWLGAILMSPHHPTGMAICGVAVLLLIGSMGQVGRKERLIPAAVAAVSFASAAGVSAYATLATGTGLAIWVVIAWMKGWRREVYWLAGIGAVALLLYAPFALALRTASPLGSFPLAPHMRSFSPIDYWLPSLVTWLKTQPNVVYTLLFVFLPVNYLAELGFFLVAAVLYWRLRWSSPEPLTPAEVLLACLAAGSVLLCSFVKSTLGWNDLGWRGFLVAQFVLLIWAAIVVERLWQREPPAGATPVRLKWWRPVLMFCAVVGIAGTATEVVNLRVHSLGNTPNEVAVRDGFMWLDRNTPGDTVVLFKPGALDFINSFYGYRQPVAIDRNYARPLWGFSPFNPADGAQGRHDLDAAQQQFQSVVNDATGFFSGDRPAGEIRRISEQYRASVIVVTAGDPVWGDRSSWVWSARPAFENASVRIFKVPDLIAQLHGRTSPAKG